MKKIMLVIAGVLLLVSILVASQEYKEKISQECGPPTATEKRVNWVWEWWPQRDEGKAFILCLGPSEFIVYRPLDIAALGLLVAAGFTFVATRRTSAQE